jgi:hypothetical protein
MKSSDLILVENFLTATRDAGYRGLSAAISELLDNSIQAGARRISVSITNPNDIGDRGATIRVSDDGAGMSPETLRGCLRFGWSTRFNDRSGSGRFGMGLPNASLSHARRIDVFTRQHHGRILWTYFDLDRPGSNGQGAIPPPVAVAKWPDMAGRRHGTTIVWTKCDRFDASRLDTLVRDLKREVGRLFRFHLWGGIKLSINGAFVGGVDPLFLKRHPTGIRAKQYGPVLRFNVENCAFNGTGEITIRFAELPIRQLSGLPSRQKQQLGLLDNAGLSVVRCRREIDRGWYFMGKKRKQNYDNWWRCEINFDAELDELFGVTHTKQGINPTRVIRQMLTPTIEKITRELSTRARSVFAKQAKGRTAAVRAVEKKDPLLEPLVHISRVNPRLRQQVRSKRRGVQLRFCVENSMPGEKRFFRVRRPPGELIVALNADHPFYERFYSRLQGQSFAATGPIVKHVEVILLAAARAETLLRTRSERDYLSRFGDLWSQVLSTYLA